MQKHDEPFLRKQAWDYFTTHASQRISIFNFYIVLSSVTATTYAAAWKDDSRLQSARWLLASLLCFFAFVFWKLDQRNKSLIKNAERALKYFESADAEETVAKVFTQEEMETSAQRAQMTGWRWLRAWDWPLTYSDCFNFVFLVFAAVGVLGILQAALQRLHLDRWLLAMKSLF